MSKVPWHLPNIKELFTGGGGLINRTWYRTIVGMASDLGDGQATETLVDVAADKFLPATPHGADLGRAIADLRIIQGASPDLAGRLSDIEVQLAQLYRLLPPTRGFSTGGPGSAITIDMLSPRPISDLVRTGDELRRIIPPDSRGRIADLETRVGNAEQLIAVAFTSPAGAAASAAPGGGVTSITAGTGLSGGVITSTGTISLAARTASTLMGNPGTAAATPSDIAIGANLTLTTAGTLNASAGGSGVTSLVIGSGLAPAGTISSGGTTISLGTIAASSLMGNPGTVGAVPDAIAVGANLTLSAAGTLDASAPGAGTVTQVATSGAGISGGPITGSGTLTVEWNAGTIAAAGPEFVAPSGTLHFDQMATYISASATIDATYFGKSLVDNSAGASDIVLTLTTLVAGTHLTFAAQNNSAHHYVRLRPGTGVTINGVGGSDYLLPNFTGGQVSIDSTGTGYTTGSALSFWNPSAGYVTGLNGLQITNNGTPSINGTLTPVVDGVSIILSGGSLAATGTAAVGIQFSVPIGSAFATTNILGDATGGNITQFQTTETIYKVYWPLATVVNGGSYIAQISAINGSNVVQSVSTSGTVVSGSVANRMLAFTFSSGVVVTAGTSYAISCSRLDGGTTFALPLVYSGSGGRAYIKNTFQLGPSGNGIFQNTVTAITAGLTLANIAAGFYGMGLDKTF